MPMRKLAQNMNVFNALIWLWYSHFQVVLTASSSRVFLGTAILFQSGVILRYVSYFKELNVRETFQRDMTSLYDAKWETELQSGTLACTFKFRDPVLKFAPMLKSVKFKAACTYIACRLQCSKLTSPPQNRE